MAEQFDPYRMWLGIPSHEQPPNLYRLLGVGLFESDQDVISGAADRQMAHVRMFQSGRYSSISQRILNELAIARVTLLDPPRRNEYDDQLRRQLATQKPSGPPPRPAPAPPPPRTGPAPAPPAAVPVAVPVASMSSPEPIPQFGRPTRASRLKPRVLATRRKRSNMNAVIVAVSAVALVVLILLAIALNSGEVEAPADKASPRNTTTQPRRPPRLRDRRSRNDERSSNPRPASGRAAVAGSDAPAAGDRSASGNSSALLPDDAEGLRRISGRDGYFSRGSAMG